jgi:hypothetical protein
MAATPTAWATTTSIAGAAPARTTCT